MNPGVSAEQKKRDQMLAILNDPRNWMLDNERAELDKELEKVTLADREKAIDAWLKFRFNLGRKEFLASRRMGNSAIKQAGLVKPQRSAPGIIKKSIPLSSVKPQGSAGNFLEEPSPPSKKNLACTKNEKPCEKVTELKLLKMYDIIKGKEKLSPTKTSRSLNFDEINIHRVANCIHRKECEGMAGKQNWRSFSCINCLQYKNPFAKERVLDICEIAGL